MYGQPYRPSWRVGAPSHGMLRAVDPALITGGTAIATGMLGYLGARLQHRAESDRLQLDRTRLEGETAALHAQRLDQQLDRRRTLYLGYLDAAETAWTLCVRDQRVTESEIDAWWRTYQGARRELAIGGATAVVAAAGEMNATLSVLFPPLVDAAREADDRESHTARLAVWAEHGTTFDQRLGDLQAAMRSDLEIPE
jgi:hypothetical protein